MKTLETIQKTCNVFHILAKVAMWLSFVWAGINVVGVICCLIWNGIGEIPGGIIDDILLELNGDAVKAIGVLLGDFVFAITDGILFFFTAKYLKQELADGTPFTEEGAKQVMSLGVKTIVMPLVAIVISAIIYACFGLSLTSEFGNGTSVVLGIALILVSLILRHGAEIRKENKNENTQNN